LTKQTNQALVMLRRKGTVEGALYCAALRIVHCCGGDIVRHGESIRVARVAARCLETGHRTSSRRRHRPHLMREYASLIYEHYSWS